MSSVSSFLKILLTLAALAACPPPPLGAQSPDQPVPGYVMRQWTTAEGLPHNSVLALLRTRDGFLWIGTARNGLVRFDGVTFTSVGVFDAPPEPGSPTRAVQRVGVGEAGQANAATGEAEPTPHMLAGQRRSLASLGASWVGALHEDEDGTLWIGTDVGLVRYRAGVFTAERLGDQDARDVIVDIKTDREGRLWVATEDRVLRREGTAWTVVVTRVDLDLDLIRRVTVSRDGTVWLCTAAGLIEWRDGIARTRTTSDGLPTDLVWAVHEDRSGRLWIATEGGLVHLDRAADRIVAPRDRSSTLPVYSLFEDSRGVLWIGSIGQVVTRARDGTLAESAFAPEADVAGIRAFTEDREGHIWFGAAGGVGGLYRLAPERVTMVTHREGLPCDNIGSIAQGPDGTIWVSAFCNDGRGVLALRDGEIISYPGPAYVVSMLVEADGAVWAGTFQGELYRLDLPANRFVEIPTPARDEAAVVTPISIIHPADDAALWLGTGRGLLRSHQGEWMRLTTADGLVGDDVRSIVGDGEGGLWIGTEAGISRYHGGQLTSYRVADGVPPRPVRAIHVDAEGVVWIGTYGGGLAHFQDGVITAYGARGGLLDSSVHRILEDEEGYLWLTGDRGIRRALKRDLHAMADGRAVSAEIVRFDEADGMRSQECNGMAQPAGWRARDGTFYFPTQRGIARIDPRPLRADAPPQPHIEQVKVDGAAVAAGSELTAAPGYRELEIHYTAPNFHRPEDVQFRYRLEGHDDQWIEVGTRRVASYSNLEPGRYRFLVTARQTGGPWQPQAATLAVTLQPHVYQRVPFQIAVGFLVLAGALVRWRVNGFRRRAEQLERAVAERTRDLSHAHEGLSAAHESLGRAKREVEQAHGQVLAVLNQTDIGVLLLSSAGIVRYASVAAQRVLRKSPLTPTLSPVPGERGSDHEALIGRHWSACLPLVEADRARIAARVDAVSSVEERVPVQMVVGGTRYWMEIDVRDEPPPGGGRILYMYNVTETAALLDGHADASHGIVGRSTVILLVRKQIQDVARVDSTVLIEGETGVGKELVARAIHQRSQRAARPFVAVNAAGLSESLLASQLFGHRRGAFTGAVDDQIGYFEAANGGTLFLDEIGDMPSTMQAGLLRVLQEREVTRLGESHPRRVDVRFIAATHRNLFQETEAGRFREDLLYRVRVAALVVPPLRNRLDDVPLLVEAFLTHAAEQAGRPVPHVSRDAMDALFRHKWPGNVRELRAAIEGALITAPGEVIRPDDLPAEIVDGHVLARDLARLPAGASERDRLLAALRQTGGNRKEAARLLGIGRTTLYRRLREYGLDEGT